MSFEFLQKHDESLLKLAAPAERCVFGDPNTALVKIRQLAETLAKSVAAEVGLPRDRDDSFLNIERASRISGLLDRILHLVMRSVQMAAHV